MVPLAGIEPALLSELDFESSASTNFTTGALQASQTQRRSNRARRIVQASQLRGGWRRYESASGMWSRPICGAAARSAIVRETRSTRA